MANQGKCLRAELLLDEKRWNVLLQKSKYLFLLIVMHSSWVYWVTWKKIVPRTGVIFVVSECTWSGYFKFVKPCHEETLKEKKFILFDVRSVITKKLSASEEYQKKLPLYFSPVT